MSLKSGFSKKAPLPAIERRSPTVKNEVVPLFPNVPRSDCKDIHEEWRTRVLFGQLKGCKEVCLVVPCDPKVLPTLFAEGTAEEKVKGSFFTVEVTKDTREVVVLKFKILPA